MAIKKRHKVIVTGATGFIGRKLIPLVVKKYGAKNILCLIHDKETDQEKDARKIIQKFKLDFKEVDLRKAIDLKGLPKNPKLIFHLAAQTDTSVPDHRANDIGTINLINSFGKIGPKTHMVYTSTIALNGGRNDCSKPINETSPYASTNEYSRTKEKAEKYLIDKCKKDNFRLTIIRLNTTYGKNYRTNSFFDVINKMVEKDSIITRINWPGLTSVIHVNDVARALVLLSQRSPRQGNPETYIMYAQNLTFSQICKKVYKAKHKAYRPINLPQPVWSFIQYLRKYIPLTEKVLTPGLYNQIWRAGLIADNTVWCKSNKLFKTLPGWKPKKLKETISEVVS